MSRTAEFAKAPTYEALLESFNDEVASYRPNGPASEAPIVFIAGAPRSGTTLLYQALAASGTFAYPTNLIARFYKNPAWGARLQRLMEPLLDRGPMRWRARAGNTEDWWGPHEFGYFWQHHLPFDAHHQPTKPDLSGLVAAVHDFARETQQPLLFKNPLLAYVLTDLLHAFPTARVLHIRRDPAQVVASILALRTRFHTDPQAWLSTRPSTAGPWDAAPPLQQIAHQLHTIEAAHLKAQQAHPDRWTDVTYSSFCAQPHTTLSAIATWLDQPISAEPTPVAFAVRTLERQEHLDAIHRALQRTLGRTTPLV